MKKLLAMLLAIMMVMTVAFAFAEGEGEGGETEVKDSGYDSPVEESLGKPTKAFNITITKGYVINGSDEASEEYPKHPADVLKFEVSTTKAPEYYFHGKKDATVTPPPITITNPTVSENAEKPEIGIAVPAFSKVGEYVYYLVETDSKTAGVTYNYLEDNMLALKFTIVNETEEDGTPTGKLIVGGIALRDGAEANPGGKTEDKEKLDNAEGDSENVHNEYEAGKLTVSKKVTGNMGDIDKPWIFKVTFTPAEDTIVRGTVALSGSGTYYGATAPTADANGNITGTASTDKTIAPSWATAKTVYFTLTDKQDFTFTNLPKGLTYEITEVEAGMYGYVSTAEASDTVVKEETKDATAQATAAQIKGAISTAAEADTAAFTNDNSQDIDTGIFMDNAPYMLIMLIAIAGVALMIARKRKEDM